MREDWSSFNPFQGSYCFETQIGLAAPAPPVTPAARGPAARSPERGPVRRPEREEGGSMADQNQMDRDAADLERFGYKQELNRGLGTFS